MIKTTLEQIKRFIPEILIAIIASSASTLMTWHVYKIGLILALTDQSAHLNFARLTFDSLTPGLSQIGFWPPLLHILMIPAVAIKPLYESGIAGFATLLPILIMGLIFIYKLTFLLTKNKGLAFLSTLILLINPYVLYYTATPMMEVLFISNVIAVAYFFSLWLEKEKIKDLVLCGIFTSLACLSRFEGFILIPILFFLILVQLVRRKRQWAEIEAIQILFGFLALLGLAFVLLFSRVYSGKFLTFSGGGWWLRSLVEGAKPTQGNLILSLKYALHGLYYMVGQQLTLISLIIAGPLLIIFRKKMSVVSSLCILVSPVFFVIYSLYNGSVPMSFPELHSTGKFFNERYVLSGIAFLSIALPLFIYFISEKMSFKINIVSKLIIAVGFIVSLYFSFQHFYSVVIVNNFETIRENIGTPSNGQLQIANYLHNNYDYGKILAVRVDNDPVFVEAGIPLKNYIHEANFKLYEQTFNQPWFFSRWVIMFNADDETDRWAQLKEPVSNRWRDHKVFNKYYQLVYKNNKKELYKIKDDLMIQLAMEQGYDVNKIPSINSNITLWDEEKIYSEIGINHQ